MLFDESPLHRVDIEVTDGALASVAADLCQAGCLNPEERAVELVRDRRTRFYRAADETVVEALLVACKHWPPAESVTNCLNCGELA